MKKLCMYAASIMLLICLISIESSAQIGVCIYPLNNTVGIKTSNLKPFSLEIRANYDVSHSTTDALYVLQPQINGIYRIRQEERVCFYTGLGGGYGFNNVSGSYENATLLAGIELYPIATMRNLTITAEFDPNAYFYNQYQNYKLTGWIGISYYFKKIHVQNS